MLLINIVLVLLILISSGFILYGTFTDNFENNKTLPSILKPIKTLPTIKEQREENEKFMKSYDKMRKKVEYQQEHETPLTWNPNNTLESMKLEPCLANTPGTNRLTCYTAPAWWYPGDKYRPENFRSIYYGDYYNPVYNYLGNAQEMYWDFKTVRETKGT